MRKYSHRKRAVFHLCAIDEQTGESLNNMSKLDGVKCLEKHGLYRYVKIDRI